MSKNEKQDEPYVKAIHDLGFASEDLREALNKATSVESIILLDLIRQTNETRIKAEALYRSRVADRAAGISVGMTEVLGV